MTNTKTYWLKQGMQRAEARVKRAQRRIAEVALRQQIEEINRQLAAIEAFRRWYPPHRADDDKQPCAVHSAPSLIRSSL